MLLKRRDFAAADRVLKRALLHNPGDPQSLSSDAVMVLEEDGPGVFWVGTFGGGLDKYDRGTGQWEHYEHEADIGVRGVAPTLAEAFELQDELEIFRSPFVAGDEGEAEAEEPPAGG